MTGISDEDISSGGDTVQSAFDTAVQQIDYPDADAARDTQIRCGQIATWAGPLGVLEDLASWVAAVQGNCPPRDFRRVRVVIFAGDHGISQAGVSSRPVGYTTDEIGRLMSGAGLVNVAAGLADAGVRLADISVAGDTDPVIATFKVRHGSARIDREDALSEDELWRAVDAGMRLADDEIDSGSDLLVIGDLGAGNTTVAATVISVLTDTEPIRVVGRAAGLDDAGWVRKCAAIRDARRRGVAVRDDLPRLLARVGGADLAAMVGFLVQAAARRTPVLLDGVFTTAAALAVQSVCPRITRWVRAGQRSDEPAQGIALERLGLNPITSFGIGTGEAAAAVLSVPVLRAAIRAVSDPES